MSLEELRRFKNKLVLNYNDDISDQDIVYLILSLLFNQVKITQIREIELAFLLWLSKRSPESIFEILKVLNNQLVCDGDC